MKATRYASSAIALMLAACGGGSDIDPSTSVARVDTKAINTTVVPTQPKLPLTKPAKVIEVFTPSRTTPLPEQVVAFPRQESETTSSHNNVVAVASTIPIPTGDAEEPTLAPYIFPIEGDDYITDESRQDGVYVLGTAEPLARVYLYFRSKGVCNPRSAGSTCQTTNEPVAQIALLEVESGADGRWGFYFHDADLPLPRGEFLVIVNSIDANNNLSAETRRTARIRKIKPGDLFDPDKGVVNPGNAGLAK